MVETIREEIIRTLTAEGMPLGLSELEQDGRRLRVFARAPATVRDMLADTEPFAERTYLVYEDERYTFADTRRIVATLATRLQQNYGIRKGDRVAIALRNYPEWIFAWYAIVSAGGIAVAVNSWWNTDEMAYALENCGAKLVFCDRERLGRILPLADRLDLSLVAVRTDEPPPARTIVFDSLLAPSTTDLPDVPLDAADDAAIVYTSGSTGHPKGAVSSHRAIIHAILSWELDSLAAAAKVQGKVPPDVDPDLMQKMLLAVPLFHVSGSHVGMLTYLRRAGTLVLMYRWDVNVAMDLIDAHGITQFTAVPTMTGDLVKAAAASGRRLDTLLSIGGGGAARDPSQVKALGDTFRTAAPGTGWGMTETNAIGASIGGQDYLERPTSSGRCSQVLDMKVVNEAGDEVPSGVAGELLVRGTSMFRGYWNDGAATREAFDGDWFRTGDVAILDEEGFIYIVDRIKQLVIRGGENIGCGEVENAIYEHPEVREAVVFGVPDERLGEEVAAVVVTRPGAALDPDALRAFLAERLSGFQMPRYVYLQMEPIPRIASGKFDKRAVRQHVIDTRFAVPARA